MEAPTKYYPPFSKLKLLMYDTKQTMAFVYGFMTSFLLCFLLILLSDPYGHSSSSSFSPSWFLKDSSQKTQSTVPCLPPNLTLPLINNHTISGVYEFFPNTTQSFPSHLQNTSSVYDESDSNELWDFQSFKTTTLEEVPLSEEEIINWRGDQQSIDSNMTSTSDEELPIPSSEEEIINIDSNLTSTSQNMTSTSLNMTNVGDRELPIPSSEEEIINWRGDQQKIEPNRTAVGLTGGINITSNSPNMTSTGDEELPITSSEEEKRIWRAEQNIEPNQTVMGPIEGTNITSSRSQNKNSNAMGPIPIPTPSVSESEEGRFSSELNKEIESMLGCDLYTGRWVKEESYPLYPRGGCPYVDENFNCSNNGRPDSEYESYRWRPKRCNIPRLNGKDLLELIRGKRLVIVGDSLNRNMWESLVCILWNSVEDQSRVVRNFGKHQFKDYDCSVEFFWAPFLVEESEICNADGSKSKRLRLDVVDSNSHKYKDADILVFNSGAWYTEFKTSYGRNYYQQGDYVHPMLDEFRAYRRGMMTWGKWVDDNVNKTKTQVLFRGNSATHFGGGKWNSGGRCDWQTKPIRKEKYLPEYPYKMKIVELVMKYMKTPVEYLNITRLTAYRKDAHPAAYRRLYKTEKERMNPFRPQDCTHWCLPGVPDTWNEILYAQLLIDKYKKKLNHTKKKSHIT